MTHCVICLQGEGDKDPLADLFIMQTSSRQKKWCREKKNTTSDASPPWETKVKVNSMERDSILKRFSNWVPRSPRGAMHLFGGRQGGVWRWVDKGIYSNLAQDSCALVSFIPDFQGRGPLKKRCCS